MTLYLLIAAMIFTFQLAEPQAVCKLSIVDPSGAPVRVKIDELTSEPVADSRFASELRESGEDGRIDILGLTNHDSARCYVYAKGFAIDLLSTSFSRSRTMLVRLQPESDIAILVVDRKENPIPNARVSPGNIWFPRSSLTENVPRRLPEYYESLTDLDGTARLHGTIADNLQSVRVSLDERRSCTFQIPKRWDRTSVLRVVWDVSFGDLVCQVVDRSGNPVAGAKLFANTNEEFLNPNVIEATTPNFVEFLGLTDKDGCIAVENVPAVPLDIRYLDPVKSIGRGEWRRKLNVVAGKSNRFEFKQKQVSRCLVTIVDESGETLPEEVAFCFQMNDRVNSITAFAKTNEDGVCEVELQPGDWGFYVTSLPAGYCIYHPEWFTKFSVLESEALQMLPPLLIAKGQLVQGNIVGIDIVESRFDWIYCFTKDGSADWSGTVNEQGEFRVIVPNYVDIDTLEKYRIADGGKGALSVESKKPLVIKWRPRNNTAR